MAINPITNVKDRFAAATYEAPRQEAITSSLLGGALAWVLVWALNQYAGAGIPAEGAVPITTIATFLVQRFPKFFSTPG